MTRVTRAPLAFLLVAAAALPAGAQGLRNHDTNAPIDVDAGRVEWRNVDRLAVWSGGVTAKQGDLTLRSTTMRVSTRPQGDSLQILRLDAQGNVRLNAPDESATANSGIYDVENRLLTLVGNVVLNQGQSVLRGQRLVVNLRTGRSTLDPGLARTTATGETSGGRVSGRFVVPDRQ